MCKENEQRVEESALIKRMQDGDITAFDEVFARYRRRLFAYVQGVVHDASCAEDVVQDCFVILAKKIGSVRPSRGLSGWLFRVAHNRAIDLIRKRRELLPGDEIIEQVLHEGNEPVPTPDAGMIGAERNVRLSALMDRLPTTERDVLMMRFYGDLKFREIAAAKRLPLGTVLWQANRGLRRLREWAGDEGVLDEM